MTDAPPLDLGPMPPTIKEQIAELKRELQMRRSVYPNWINVGRLRQDTAAHRLACIESTLAFLIVADRLNDKRNEERKADDGSAN